MYLFRDNNNYYVIDKKKLLNFYHKLDKNLYSTAFIALDEIEFDSNPGHENWEFLGKKMPYIASIGILEFNEYTKKFDAVMVKTYIFNKCENISQIKGGFKEMLDFLETYIYDRNINFLVCNRKEDLTKLMSIANNIAHPANHLQRIVANKAFIDLKSDLEKQPLVSILTGSFNLNTYIRSIVDELYDLDDLTKKDNDILRKDFFAIKETNKPLFKKVTRLNIIEIQQMKLKLNFIYQFKNIDYDLALNSQMQKKQTNKIDLFSFKEKTIKEKFKTKNWTID